MNWVPASQGQRGEGSTRCYADPGVSEGVLEGALIGVRPSRYDKPEDILEQVRASKSSAVPAGLIASAVSGTSLAPAHMAR